MTDRRFELFWPKLMKYEGWAKIVNDPDDAGGLTKYGISKRAYPHEDIMNLTEARAKELYWNDYYTKLKIPEIVNDRLAWQVFDFGVNAGVNRSARTLQNILELIPDGVIGSKTINAINLFQDEYPLYIHFISKRLMYYLMLTERNPTYIKFLKGWIFRAMEL